MKPLREHVFSADSSQLRCFRYDQRCLDVTYHYHPEIEVTLIERGTGTLAAGDHTHPFGPFDLCMFGENLPHFYQSDSRESGRGQVSSIAEVVQFPRELWESWVEGMPADMRKLDLLFARAQRGLHFPEKAARDLVPVFRDLRESSGLRRLTSLLRLLDALVEQGGTPMAELNFGFGDSEGSESIRRARTILLSEFRENLVHEEVAMRVHLSPAAFSRQFKWSTGITFQEFLTRLRLGEAVRLLIETDRRISEICYECGYGNLSNFNRQFKVRRGRTPTAFRTHWHTVNH